MGKQVLTCIWNFYFSSRRRHTRFSRDWSSDVCSSDLADAIVLRSKRSVPRWLWLLASAPARPVLVFEAGEVPLDRGNALRELVFLAETMIVRLKRGVVVRPPRGIRAPTFPSSRLHALAARLSQVALWRDAVSAA